jgi:uncharacterized protein
MRIRRSSLKVAALAFVVLLVAVAAAVVAIPSWRLAALDHLPPRLSIELQAVHSGVTVDHSITITMSDGVVLAGSLYRPRGTDARLPTILVMVPYGRLSYAEGPYNAIYFAKRGYSALVVDLRGAGDSGGELTPWRGTASDGVQVLDWISRQPWSTGKVGTFGCSALGETQMVLGARNHPAHRALIASGAGGAIGSAAGRSSYFGMFEGGVFQLAGGFGWFSQYGSLRPDAPPSQPFEHASLLRELPVESLVSRVRPAPNGYTEFMSLPLADPRWRDLGYLSDDDEIRVPSFIINTWGDQTLGDSLAYAEMQRQREAAKGQVTQRVVIAPGNHCHQEKVAEKGDFGELKTANADRPWREWFLKWFDFWLKGEGTGLADLPPYTYFMVGEDRWYEADTWPPKTTQPQRWYLGSAGHANSSRGDGSLGLAADSRAASDVFRYDPQDPVPSRGGPVCCTGNHADHPGPADQRDVETRDDVLVYTSPKLMQDLRIAGPVRAHFAFSSDAPDTDLVARLVDVFPDGRSIGIQEGALQLRYRNGYENPALLPKDEVQEVSVDMRSIAYRFGAGHRLRLDVTSSSFPRLARNLNSGETSLAGTHPQVATNRVHYAPTLSFVELDVMGADAPAGH